MSAWLASQQAFWRQLLDRDADEHPDLANAQAFWDDALARWWAEMHAALPAALAGPMEAALAQTRLYLELAQGVTRDGAAAHASVLTDLFLSQLEGFAHVFEAERNDEDEDAGAQRRYALAYARVTSALSEVVTDALGTLRPAAGNDPRSLYIDTCQALERCYRERAASEEFAALLGELVNARVALMPACESPSAT